MGKGDRKATVFVGESYPTLKGSVAKVLVYESSFRVLVELPSGLQKWVRADHLRKGNVFDPYHPSVCGVGFIGEGRPSKENGKLNKAYGIWSDMIHRCYNPKTVIDFPNYEGCYVVEHWHNFQNFAKWFEEYQYKQENWELDKDIIVQGNKVYGPETCCFVSHYINILMSRSTLRDFDSVGSQLRKGYGYRVFISENGKQTYHGMYKTAEEAKEVYRKEKLKVIKNLAEKHKEQLDPRAYESLINWRLDSASF